MKIIVLAHTSMHGHTAAMIVVSSASIDARQKLAHMVL